jgi:hypothetical protein
VPKFRYFGTILTHKKCIHEETKGRLNLGMFATIQFRIFVFLLATCMKVKMQSTIILLIVLYGCEIFCLVLRAFKRRVLKDM